VAHRTLADQAKLKETGAPLAGEMSGHIFFNDRWYGFDDAVYSGSRLLELLSKVKDPSAELEALPDATTRQELQLKTAEGENFALVERLKAEAKFDAAREVIRSMECGSNTQMGSAFARPSNTTPVRSAAFRGRFTAALERIQQDFRRALLAVKPDARLPF